MIRIADMASAIVPTQIREVTKLATPSSLNLGIGQPDLPFPESVRAAITTFADRRRAPYVPNAGTTECREAIAAYEGCHPDEVLITCGVQEALAVSIFGVVQPGDKVIISDPCFPAYPNLIRAVGAEPIELQMDENWSWNPDSVQDAIDKHSPSALILNNPSNPTGVVEHPAVIDRIATICAAHDVAIISDEIYEAFIFGNAVFRTPRTVAPQNTLKLGGLSKTFAMMGFRLGWVVAPAETIRALTPLHQHLVTSAPSISMAAAIAALGDTDAQKSIVETMRERAKLTTQLAGELLADLPPGSGFMEPNGAFYLMLGLAPPGTDVDDVDVAKRLLASQDVVTIPGSGFGAGGRGHLRIAYTVEADILTEAFGRMRQFLSENA